MEANRKEFGDFRRFVGSKISDQEEVPELSHQELF